MRFGRIGGMLVMDGVMLVGMGYALVIVGAAVGNLVTGAATALIGSGAAILCVIGPRPLQGRVMRVGLGTLAAGLASLLAFSIVAGTLTYDPLESLPFVVLGIGGVLAMALGSLVTAVSLLRAPGPPNGGLAAHLWAGALSPRRDPRAPRGGCVAAPGDRWGAWSSRRHRVPPWRHRDRHARRQGRSLRAGLSAARINHQSDCTTATSGQAGRLRCMQIVSRRLVA
jgi:hypothetical protein